METVCAPGSWGCPGLAPGAAERSGGSASLAVPTPASQPRSERQRFHRAAEYCASERTRRDGRGQLWWFQTGLSGSSRAPFHHFEIGAAGEPWRGLSLGGSLQSLAVPENAAGTVPVPR